MVQIRSTDSESFTGCFIDSSENHDSNVIQRCSFEPGERFESAVGEFGKEIIRLPIERSRAKRNDAVDGRSTP